MHETIYKKFQELKSEMDSIDIENIASEMNDLINKLSGSKNKNGLAELDQIKEMFGNLSRNMLSLADFLDRKFPEKN